MVAQLSRLTIGVVLLLGVIPGCGGGGDNGTRGACVSGASVACTCTNGATGAQICLTDGSGYGACMCSSSTGAGGNPGAGGSSGAGGAGGLGTGGAGTGGVGTGGAGSGGSAALRIISVDFVGGRMAASGIPMGSTEVAGAKPAANWNSAAGGTGMLANLVFSDGVASGASVTWSPPVQSGDLGTWSIGYSDVPGDVRMMNGFLGPTSSAIPATGTTLLTVSGLPASIASGSYDVYVYVLGSPVSMRSYQYAIGNTAITVIQSTGPPILPATPYPYMVAPDMGMGTHIVFRGVTGASFALTVKPVAGATTSPRAPVNGFQIVSPSGS
jgi:hypothetical protein